MAYHQPLKSTHLQRFTRYSINHMAFFPFSYGVRTQVGRLLPPLRVSGISKSAHIFTNGPPPLELSIVLVTGESAPLES